MRRISVLFVIVLILGTIVPATATQGATEPLSLRISEIKLGESKPASEEPLREFVEIYNPHSTELALTNVRLEHAKVGFSADACGELWTGPDAKTYAMQPTSIDAGQTLVIAVALADTAAGSLRLVELDDQGELDKVHDLVGWGAEAPCYESTAATTPAKGKSLHALLDCNGLTLASKEANDIDYAVTNTPNPELLGTEKLALCTPEEPAPSPTEPTPLGSCAGLVISEILPNPAGADGGQEFIELYNTTDSSISLEGCSIQILGSNTFLLPAQTVVNAGEFVAFSDSESGLTLPNASGGTLFLLDTDGSEIYTASYPADMEDDTAWAWFGGANWEASYTSTPNAENIRQPDKPCPAGEERSIETGRCRTIAAENQALAPCAEGQTRNPETNRCRAVAETASALVACKPGQERNPETNRCRSTTTASADLKACPAGQERNPETNRCRKATGAQVAGITDVQDVPSPAAIQSWHWWVAGIAATGAVGYGAYEWRHSIRRFFDKLRGKVE